MARPSPNPDLLRKYSATYNGSNQKGESRRSKDSTEAAPYTEPYAVNIVENPIQTDIENQENEQIHLENVWRNLKFHPRRSHLI